MLDVNIMTVAAWVIGLLVAVAPVIIWRNTNRTNRLLALLLERSGVPSGTIRDAWEHGGAQLHDATERERRMTTEMVVNPKDRG